MCGGSAALTEGGMKVSSWAPNPLSKVLGYRTPLLIAHEAMARTDVVSGPVIIRRHTLPSSAGYDQTPTRENKRNFMKSSKLRVTKYVLDMISH